MSIITWCIFDVFWRITLAMEVCAADYYHVKLPEVLLKPLMKSASRYAGHIGNVSKAWKAF